MKYFKNALVWVMAAMTAASVSAADGLVTLDLSKAETVLNFNATTGEWDQTFSDEEPTIDSQLYCFMHSALPSYNTWWGFTVSNSANNQPQTDWLAWQYSNMAKGGVALNEDGTIKTNDKGAPVSDPKMPYLVAYYNKFMARKPVQLLTNDGEAHAAVGCYVNLNSYAFYSVLFGDAVARAFTEDDRLWLTINGVAADGSTKSVEVTLASYKNGQLSASTGWMYVDLSSLGAVNELYFTMDSSDSGAWGMNTPGYFCLDKLTMKSAATTSVAALSAKEVLNYNRAERTLTGTPGKFMALYTVSGTLVQSTEEGRMDVSSVEHGVYIARSGNRSLKIVI